MFFGVSYLFFLGVGVSGDQISEARYTGVVDQEFLKISDNYHQSTEIANLDFFNSDVELY